MTWQTEAFRDHYRLRIGTPGSSNSYVSYLNRVDELVSGLDERLDKAGGDDVIAWLQAQPSISFGRARPRSSCISALRAYISFRKGVSENGGAVVAERGTQAGHNPAPSAQKALHPDKLASLLLEVKSLGARYYELTGKPLGVTGEVAEMEAAQKLGLTLLTARSPGYDAVAADGQRIQIKGRAVAAHNRYRGRCPAIKGQDFDAVCLVLLDKTTLEPLEIWKAPVSKLIIRLDIPGSRARNERRSLAIMQFKSEATLVWSESV